MAFYANSLSMFVYSFFMKRTHAIIRPLVFHVSERACERMFGPSGSITRVEQRGNVEPSALRHPCSDRPRFMGVGTS